MSISKIMAGPFGSFIKAFLVAFLSLIMARQKDGTLCFDAQCKVLPYRGGHPLTESFVFTVAGAAIITS